MFDNAGIHIPKKMNKLLSGTEFNELEMWLNYQPPVQILNHRFKSSWILNFESLFQELKFIKVYIRSQYHSKLINLHFFFIVKILSKYQQFLGSNTLFMNKTIYDTYYQTFRLVVKLYLFLKQRMKGLERMEGGRLLSPRLAPVGCII